MAMGHLLQPAWMRTVAQLMETMMQNREAVAKNETLWTSPLEQRAVPGRAALLFRARSTMSRLMKLMIKV